MSKDWKEPNNLKLIRSKKMKGHRQNRQNQLRLFMHERDNYII